MLSKFIGFLSGSVLTFSFINYAYDLSIDNNNFLKKIKDKDEDNNYIGDIVL